LYDKVEGKPVFAQLSDDGKAIWGAVVEKAYAKVLGNYLKTEGGSIINSIRILTGSPVLSYSTYAWTKTDIFPLFQEADKANYIMGAGVTGGTTELYNYCGLRNNHAYTILSAFTMTDA
jgi:hypothetical protein